MRKSSIVLFLMLLSMVCLGCQSEANQAQPKIGVVDGERLMRDSAPGKEAMKFIEGRQNAIQQQLGSLQDKLEKNPEDEAIQQEFQKLYTTSMQKLQAEAQNAANIVQDAIKRCLNAWREKNGFDMLVYSEMMASYNSTVDVTNAILAELDKQKVEFKPLEPAPQSPDAKAGAPTQGADSPAQAAPAANGAQQQK